MKANIKILLFLAEFQCTRELVRTGRAASVAVCAPKTCDYIVNTHTLDKRAYALGVTVAAVDELYIADLPVPDVEQDLPGTGALGGVLVSHGSFSFVSI